MKNIFIVLTLVLYGFISNSYAEEIKMKCTYSGNAYYGANEIFVKYTDSLISRKKIYVRHDAKWHEWCKPRKRDISKEDLDHDSDETFEVKTKRITKRGGRCLEKNSVSIRTVDNVKLNYLCDIKIVLDFEDMTRKINVFCEDGGDGKEREKEEIWTCEKVD